MKKIFAVAIALNFFLFLPVKVFAGNPPVENNSQFTTPSGTVASDGTSTETFSVHLQDSNQSAVTGDVITASSSNNTSATFPQNNQTTDGSGNATFTVASTTAGDTKITITDTTNNVSFTDWFTVTFYDSSKGCSNVPAAPILSSVVSNSNNTATLNWVDSANPVNNYLVSYGITSKSYVYGDSNVGSQGTASFTIGSLTGNKKYYFVVAANNNCGASGFSNEVSVVVKPIPSTPAPTIAPTDTPISTTPPTTDTLTAVTVATDAPTDTPQGVATPQASTGDTNTTFRNIGIGVVVAGVVVIALVFILQKSKKKNQIPPFSSPFDQPPTVPPSTIPPQTVLPQ